MKSKFVDKSPNLVSFSLSNKEEKNNWALSINSDLSLNFSNYNYSTSYLSKRPL